MCPDFGPGIILWVAPRGMGLLSLAMRLRQTSLAIIAIILQAPMAAMATPQLAARYAQDCGLCHVNPTGGGLRNSYASQYILPAELSLRPLSAHDREHWPNPRLNDFITLGIDMRTLYYAASREVSVSSEGADASARAGQSANRAVAEHEGHGFTNEENSFFEMQGDLYVAFEPDPSFLIYLDKGLYSGFEAFLLARVLPAHGYVKVGQFVPDIGWRWDDHNRLSRIALSQDYNTGRVTDVGIELGASPGRLSMSVGVYNGSTSASFDDNSQKMVMGRVLYRTRAASVHTAIGGSARLNHGTAVREEVWGGQVQAAFGERVTYVGDAFSITSMDLIGTLGEVPSFVASQEVDVQLRRGFDAYIGYDFLDPNLDYESGTHTLVSLGLRVYPRHFMQIQPIFRWEEIGDDTIKRFELILHGFY
jgi:hypothetical protein